MQRCFERPLWRNANGGSGSNCDIHDVLTHSVRSNHNLYTLDNYDLRNPFILLVLRPLVHFIGNLLAIFCLVSGAFWLWTQGSTPGYSLLGAAVAFAIVVQGYDLLLHSIMIEIASN